jgi:hypothetical protein
MKKFTFAAALLVTSVQSAFAQAPNANTLLYRHPAPEWNQALPIGNGRLGAMCSAA